MTLPPNVLPPRTLQKGISTFFLLPVYLFSGFLFFIILLFQTILFPYNPLLKGYFKIEGDKYILVSRDERIIGLEFSPDELLDRLEASHRYSFRKKVRIVLCTEKSELFRLAPYVRFTEDIMGAAITPGIICLTPELANHFSFIEKVIAHEASHSLLMQQNGLIRSRLLWHEAAWIPEGLAVLKSGWPDYRKGNYYGVQIDSFLKEHFFEEEDLWKVVETQPVTYQYFFYTDFTEFIINLGGKERYYAFLDKVIHNPLAWRKDFEAYYNKDFESAFFLYARSRFKDENNPVILK